MGGRNHQPCGVYLPESTRVSRELSIAHAQCELANVSLEDLILAELDGGHGETRIIVEHLSASANALANADKLVDELEAKMDKNDFIDLPTLRVINLDAIGTNFVERGLTSFDDWRVIVSIMRTNGFRSMLGRFRVGIAELRRLTQQLQEEIARLDKAAKCGETHLVLEENRVGNIKPTFTRLYTSWGRFNSLFLASSLLSTEVWYAFRGYGSLAESTSQVRVA